MKHWHCRPKLCTSLSPLLSLGHALGACMPNGTTHSAKQGVSVVMLLTWASCGWENRAADWSRNDFFSHWRIWVWLSRSRKVTRNGIIQHLTSPPVLSQSVLLRTSAGASLPLLYHNGGNPSVHHLVRLKNRWITWWALWLHREYQQETWASSSSHTGVLQSTDCNPVFGTHNMKTCSLLGQQLVVQIKFKYLRLITPTLYGSSVNPLWSCRSPLELLLQSDMAASSSKWDQEYIGLLQLSWARKEGDWT